MSLGKCSKSPALVTVPYHFQHPAVEHCSLVPQAEKGSIRQEPPGCGDWLPQLPVTGAGACLDTGIAVQLLLLFCETFGVLFLRLLPPTLSIHNKNIIGHVCWRVSERNPAKSHCTSAQQGFPLCSCPGRNPLCLQAAPSLTPSQLRPPQLWWISVDVASLGPF